MRIHISSTRVDGDNISMKAKRIEIKYKIVISISKSNNKIHKLTLYNETINKPYIQISIAKGHKKRAIEF